MNFHSHPIPFWIIVFILCFSLLLLLAGQTMAIIDYELAVSMGLQENVAAIGEFGVAVNKAFGVSDTIVYIPIIIVSIVGLVLRKNWALYTTAAVMGVSAYWAVTVAFMFIYLDGVPGYQFVPGIEYWAVISFYILFGVWGLIYLVVHGEKLI